MKRQTDSGYLTSQPPEENPDLKEQDFSISGWIFPDGSPGEWKIRFYPKVLTPEERLAIYKKGPW